MPGTLFDPDGAAVDYSELMIYTVGKNLLMIGFVLVFYAVPIFLCLQIAYRTRELVAVGQVLLAYYLVFLYLALQLAPCAIPYLRMFDHEPDTPQRKLWFCVTLASTFHSLASGFLGWFAKRYVDSVLSTMINMMATLAATAYAGVGSSELDLLLGTSIQGMIIWVVSNIYRYFRDLVYIFIAISVYCWQHKLGLITQDTGPVEAAVKGALNATEAVFQSTV